MKVERSPRRLLSALVPHVRDGLAAGYLPPSAIGSASSSEKPIHLLLDSNRRVQRMVSVCESERAD